MAQGVPCKRIAKELSVTPQTISEWNKSPVFIASLNSLKMDVIEATRSGLQHSSMLAVSTLIEIMEGSEKDEVRRRASLDILRLAGFDPSLKGNSTFGIGATTEDEVKAEIAESKLHPLLKGRGFNL